LIELEDTWGFTGVFDQCCVGDSWGDDDEYYDSTPTSCGDARTCDIAIYLGVCQDNGTITQLRSQCCADGRWHVVKGDHQYEPTPYVEYLLEDQRSPACGGTVWHSSRALHFDGASYLELPVEVGTGYPEVEVWFRTSSPSGPLLAGTSREHRVYLSEGKLCFDSAGANDLTLCTSEASFADGAWHHAAHTRHGLYADGTMRVEGYDFNDPENVTTFRAGYNPVDGATPQYFAGDLDEIRIWRQHRHRTAILDYQATRLVDEGTRRRLFGYYPLEQSGSESTASNEALPYIKPDCEGIVAGAGGAEADLPGAALVGFDFTTSPWIEPGAF